MAVLVLLSSFRGKLFIREQIQSILDQQDVQVRVMVRDDGSQDGTNEILAAMARGDSRLCCIAEENRGVVSSFFRLIEAADVQPGDFIAFADQDDIWPPTRLARQLDAMSTISADTPGLCFGGFSRVDAEGRPIPGPAVFPPLPDLAALLTENQVPGCTMMVNYAGFELVRSHLPPAADVFMHDWWIEQVIAYTGSIVRLDEVVLYYRQHDGNLVGSPGRLQEWRDRLERSWELRGRHPLLRQARELRVRLGDRMSEENRCRIDRLLRAGTGNLGDRLRFVSDSSFRRARRSDDLYLRALLLGGYFRSHVQ